MRKNKIFFRKKNSVKKKLKKKFQKCTSKKTKLFFCGKLKSNHLKILKLNISLTNENVGSYKTQKNEMN